MPVHSMKQSTTDDPTCMHAWWNACTNASVVWIQYFHIIFSLGYGHKGHKDSLVV